MKVKNEFFATARDGKPQKFNAYPIYKDGVIVKYMTRFYVDNYKGGTKKQWCGKGCGFKKQEDAIAFGYKIASAVQVSKDWPSVKAVVELNAAYTKAFS
jgi:hypothetical protein